MCRLLGYVSTHPTAVVDVLGPEGFDTFTALTAVHGDGWGMAWHDPADATTRSATSAASAMDDPTYRELAEQPLGHAGLVHLRWATGGLPVSAENTHPFVDDGYAFAHNGHVAPIDRLEELLAPASRSRLRGDTDSERYFRFLLQSIDEHGDEVEGVTRALEVLMREFPDASLNAFLLGPRRMFAIHVNSRAHSPIKALREIFESEDAMPADHANAYFAMGYRITEEAVHVISSGLEEEGWTRVPSDMAVAIDLATREVTTLNPVSVGVSGS